MDTKLKTRMLNALKSEEAFLELQKIAVDLRDNGHNRETVEKDFKDFLQDLMEHGTEDEEDVVRDVLDLITGWCHPDADLFRFPK